MHQLRKHFKHIFHPILGSRPHGCNKQNKLWLEHFELTGMMLHASVNFNHPINE
jgi:tRNA pseudouridine65 synthase